MSPDVLTAAPAAEPTLDEHLASSIVPVAEPDAPESPAAARLPLAAPVQDDDDADPDAAAATEAAKTLSGRKKTARERIAQLEWEKHEERRAREKIEAELQALRQPKVETPTSDPTEPKLKSYIDQIGAKYLSYEDASEAFTKDLLAHTSAQAQQASVAASAQRAYQDAVQTTRARGLEKHADFDARLTALAESGRTFTPWMTEAILGDADQGHDLAYALASEPETYDQLRAADSPVKFAKVLGKILTRLEGATPGASPIPPVKSTAVPPLTPVTSSPVAADVGVPDDDSLDAHIARENKADRLRRTAARR